MFLYVCIQDLVKTQVFTSGNISEANQNVVSKVQRNKSDIGYHTHALCARILILHSFVVLHLASP